MGRALEILWLMIGIFCLGLAINKTLSLGIKNTYTLYLISLLAFAMFFLRKKLRKSTKK
ncbi:MAG: hypothetical protein JXB17_05935 [Bacteroidales bacterium]|nr:hypothetical protein [Bacteroidales bacterium]